MKSRALLLLSVAVLVLILVVAYISTPEDYEGMFTGHSMVLVGSLIILAGLISLQTRVSTSILELITGCLAAITPLAIIAYDHTFILLSEIGAIVLMFIVGMEINVEVVMKNIKASLILGALSFLIPFITSLLALHYILGIHDLRSYLISTGVSTTSVAILYIALKDLGMFNSDLGQTMFAGAMVTDLISMIVLTVIIGKFSLLSLAYPIIILFIIVVLPALLDRVIKLKAPWELEIKFILLTLIFLALLSESIGVHSAISSFLIGIAFSETVRSHETLVHKIKGLGFSFFIPIFFFRAGLLINFNALLHTLYPLAIIAGVAIITKYLGSLLPLKLFFKTIDYKLPFLFNARLAIGTIAAIYGLKYGIIQANDYAIIISLVILSSIPVAIVLNRIPPITPEEPM